ncbi:MAG TPA: glycosyltransferase family 4 protein [Planctomycetota bacterium]|nr:glycosyltransferase family 4 protein [Planctomycetota bacterium]
MSRKLTILHLVSLMGIGGRCATALRQMRLLAARGHTVLVGCLPGSTAAERSRAMKLEVFDSFRFKRGFRPLDFFHDTALLRQICDSRKVDVVHAHLSQESWIACLGIGRKRRSQRPAVIRSRGVVVPVKPHAFNRWMHNTLTDHIITPSTVIYDGLRKLPGFDAQKISLIVDGVDTERFKPENDGAAIRAEFNIAPDASLVVMVARLERVKGHEIFFKALAKLVRDNSVPGLRALCACDERTPGMLAKTIEAARAEGLDEKLLQFTGMRGDVENIFAAADVIALPSRGSEGSSRVALEAGASGKPIVATSVGCLPEVIQHGATGMIVKATPPQNGSGNLMNIDPTEFAAALAGLLKDRAASRQMGEAARKRVKELYDEQKMVERLEAVYLASVR